MELVRTVRRCDRGVNILNKLGLNITLLSVTALICVTALEVVALMNGINGVALSTTIGLIVSLPTFAITRLICKRGNGKKNE